MYKYAQFYGNITESNGKYESWICETKGNIETIITRKFYKSRKAAENFFIRKGFQKVDILH